MNCREKFYIQDEIIERFQRSFISFQSKMKTLEIEKNHSSSNEKISDTFVDVCLRSISISLGIALVLSLFSFAVEVVFRKKREFRRVKICAKYFAISFIINVIPKIVISCLISTYALQNHSDSNWRIYFNLVYSLFIFLLTDLV